MQGLPTTSLAVQLDFIWYELEKFPEYGLAKLRAATNVTDATQVFEDNFEGCVYANYPVCNLPQRVTFAKNALAAYGNDPVPGDAAVTTEAASTVDAKPAGDSAPTEDQASADGGGATSDDASGEPATSVPPVVTEPPPAHDAQTPHATSSEAGTPSTFADIDSSGCAIQPRGAGESRPWLWLVAIGLVLGRARRRRLRHACAMSAPRSATTTSAPWFKSSAPWPRRSTPTM
jgi:hypothetical protein